MLCGISEEAAVGKQRRLVLKLVVIAVIALDSLDLGARTKHEADALMQSVWDHLQDGLVTGTRATSSLLHDHSNGVRLV